jgi:hypothetical protein
MAIQLKYETEVHPTAHESEFALQGIAKDVLMALLGRAARLRFALLNDLEPPLRHPSWQASNTFGWFTER